MRERWHLIKFVLILDILIHFAEICNQNLKFSKIACTVDFGWVHIRDLHGKFSSGMPWEKTGNAAGEGIKLATATRDGNLTANNPAVAVGRIISQLVGNKYV